MVVLTSLAEVMCSPLMLMMTSRSFNPALQTTEMLTHQSILHFHSHGEIMLIGWEGLPEIKAL